MKHKIKQFIKNKKKTFSIHARIYRLNKYFCERKKSNVP